MDSLKDAKRIVVKVGTSTLTYETGKTNIRRMKELVEEYNQIQDDDEHKDEKKAKWRVLVASLPCGFCLCATMTTNYQQLKTMYRQRCNHKLKEWHVFCDWILSLPHFKELTGLGE